MFQKLLKVKLLFHQHFVANNIALPEITSKADFKKLTQTSDIDLEPSKAKLEEAMRILGE